MTQQRVKLTVEEYIDELLALVEPLAATGDVETIALGDALGRVLASDVTAVGPIPAFDNSAMDGYAVRHADLSEGVRLQVVGDIPAGSSANPAIGPGQCVRIMTGAPVPDDADTIVQVEYTANPPDAPLREGSTVSYTHVDVLRVPKSGAHVRYRGEDVPAGAVVLTAGQLLTPSALATAAGAGRPALEVVRRPRVGIIATGDELVAPGGELGHGQIFESNGTFLAAAIELDGGRPVRGGEASDGTASDDVESFVAALDALAECDLVVISGGVSVGDYDVTRLALAQGDAAFRHVIMQPGKPQGWARWPRDGRDPLPVVALPGNPVSVMVSYDVLVRPMLERLMGRPGRPWNPAIAGADWRVPVGRRQYIPVAISFDGQGRQVATPTHRGGSGSHLVTSGAAVDALAMVAAEVEQVQAGDEVAVRRLW